MALYDKAEVDVIIRYDGLPKVGKASVERCAERCGTRYNVHFIMCVCYRGMELVITCLIVCVCCRDVVLGVPLVPVLLSAGPRCDGAPDARHTAETPEGAAHHPAAGQRGLPGLSHRRRHHQ